MPTKLATRGKFGGIQSLASWGKLGIPAGIRLIYEKILRIVFKKDDAYRVFEFDNAYKVFTLDNAYRMSEFDDFRRIFVKEDERRVF